MNRKYYRLKLSDVSDEGVIEGHGSVANNIDLGRDVVKSGAFLRTLSASKGQLPMLFNHSVNEPIGMWEEMREDGKGLYVRGKLNMEVARAREIYALLKQGAIKGLSIGYEIVKDRVEKGVRYLLELKLYEVSVVVFPMNELAAVEGVKSVDLGGNKYLAPWADMNDRNQVTAACRVALSTLEDALYVAAWTQEMEDDEAVAYVDESLTQFHAAMLELFTRKRTLAQAQIADGKAANNPLALPDFRLVSSKQQVIRAIGDLKALLEQEGESDPGQTHSDEPTETGPADEPEDSSEAAPTAHSEGETEGSSDIASLIDAIRSATPPPIEGEQLQE